MPNLPSLFSLGFLIPLTRMDPAHLFSFFLHLSWTVAQQPPPSIFSFFPPSSWVWPIWPISPSRATSLLLPLCTLTILQKGNVNSHDSSSPFISHKPIGFQN